MKSLLSLVATLFLTISLSAQTVEEIVAKHLAAIGGKDVLTKTVSLYQETSTSVMGNDAPGKIYILNGKGFKSEMEMMGNTMTQCVSAKGGWATQPMSSEINDMPEEQAKGMMSQAQLGGVFVNYPENGTTIELDGRQKVNGLDAFKLKVTPKGGRTVQYYIDPTTYYHVRTDTKGEMMGQEVNITMNFSDFKKLENGYVMPHATEIDLGQFQLTTTVTKVEINKEISETIFVKK